MTVREYLNLQDDGCPNCGEHLIGAKRAPWGQWSVTAVEGDQINRPFVVATGFSGFVMLTNFSPNESSCD